MRVATLAVVLLVSTLCPRAAEAKAGLVYVHTKPKVVHPGEFGSRSATCPSGTKAIGGGGDIVGKNTATVISQSFPFDNGDAGKKPDDGWKVTMFSRSASDKSLIGYAICSSSGALSYITSSGSIGDGGRTTLYADCPDGTLVTSGGGSLDNADIDQIDIAATKPYDGGDPGDIPDNGWQTTFDNDTGSAQNAKGFAICAGSGTYVYVSTSTTVASGTQGHLFHDCAPDSNVVGGGVSITATGGPDEFELAASFPSDSLDADSKPDDSWTGDASNISSGAPLTMDMYLVCRPF